MTATERPVPREATVAEEEPPAAVARDGAGQAATAGGLPVLVETLPAAPRKGELAVDPLAFSGFAAAQPAAGSAPQTVRPAGENPARAPRESRAERAAASDSVPQPDAGRLAPALAAAVPSPVPLPPSQAAPANPPDEEAPAPSPGPAGLPDPVAPPPRTSRPTAGGTQAPAHAPGSAVRPAIPPVAGAAPSPRPAGQADALPAAGDLSAGLSVRQKPAGAGEAGQLAFAARLTAQAQVLRVSGVAAAAPEGHRTYSPRQAQAHSDKEALPATAKAPAAGPAKEEPARADADPAPPAANRPTAAHEPAESARGEAAPLAVHETSAATTPLRTMTAPGNAASSTAAVADPPRGTGDAPRSASRTVLEAAAATEPAKPAAPAREIRLEMARGDGRVEVRLSERAGNLEVAVRTPDNHLAERLREGLPALSDRLAENGVRTETWHTGEVLAPGWRQNHEAPAAAPGGRDDTPPGRQGQEQQPGEGQQRRPRHPDENQPKQEKGKDFEWFLSATR
ncbi:MAG: hypothetical protein JST11_14315 [Acidobacteria bacterium]|nr:hypothetical protein [Acidobacteriota bacterium]